MTAPKDRAWVVRVMAEGGVPEGWVDELDLALAKLHLEALEAAGLRVVPVALTASMLGKAKIAIAGTNSIDACWAAMLAASPFAPPPEDPA